jgi:DNA-directed RNA polymerase specialized sigma24 family protein
MRERVGCGDFAQVQSDPEALIISLARATTIGLVRKYFARSVEMGRLPSVLGREVFHAKCSSYTLETFEDTVIFVLDMERCVEALDANSQMLIALLTMEELRMDEVAERLNVALRRIMRAYGNALDDLTRVLIERGILKSR